MTTAASNPLHVMDLFASRAGEGDLEGVVALYEEQAIFQPKDGVQLVGHDQIRDALGGLTALKPQIEYLGVPEVITVDDIALVKNSWKMVGVTPDGTEVVDEGISADVVRRQNNGEWLILIDQPRGTHPA